MSAADERAWTSIPAMVRASVERFADAEAVVDGEVRWTYRELGEQVDRAVAAVIGAGLAPGERAAIWAPNIREWIVAALGILGAGGVLVPLNTRFKGEEARDILLRSKARMLFTVDAFLDADYVAMLHKAGDVPGLEQIILLRGGADADARTWGDVLAAADSGAQPPNISAGDLSDLIFTSGTTGAPKGVMTTHGQTLKVFEVWSRLVGLDEGDRYLIVNPFFHTFGYKAGFLAAIMRGATIIPQPVFDAGAVLARIGEEKVTVLPGPPTLYQSLLNHPELGSTDISSLQLAVTGAAVVPVELIKRMSDELGFDTVLTAYGLTEATGVVSMCGHGDDATTVANTCGTAIPDTEVRVVDDERRPLPPGEPGEVVVRGYNVMQGYYEDPDQTAETIKGGWLHTGDIGVLDERGYLKITDRKKDMFIVGGFNAYPAEIENVLSTHDDIAQAAVVGVPDERLGEVGLAFVVARHGAQVDGDAVIEWCRERMANYKVPRRIEVVDALPLNAGGKVLKNQLRERVR